MKKTPLSKLIKQLNDMLISSRRVIDNPSLHSDHNLYLAKERVFYTEPCIQKATELLEEERQNLIEAYETVQGREDGTLIEDGDEYFKNTYEQ